MPFDLGAYENDSAPMPDWSQALCKCGHARVSHWAWDGDAPGQCYIVEVWPDASCWDRRCGCQKFIALEETKV